MTPRESAPSPERSYSTAYVARRLGVSIPTIQRWVDSGQLKAWKTLGGHRRIEAESAEKLFAARQHEGVAPEVFQPLHVIVVDDNPVDREILVLLVQSALPGAEVRSFESAVQGLVAIGQQVPDVLVTDLLMPHMDGVEMLHQLATRCEVRPRLILAVSSQSPAQIARRGTLPGDVVFVAKPVEPEVFVATLRAAVSPAQAAPARPT